jgi:hypothetical protein
MTAMQMNVAIALLSGAEVYHLASSTHRAKHLQRASEVPERTETA